MNPFRILPLQLLRLFPSIRRKRVVCLCHASIFGKSHSPSSFVMKISSGVIYWYSECYDSVLFFSPKSMEESVIAGLDYKHCRLISWGADLSYIKSHISHIVDGDFWLSTGKVQRDFETMEKAAIDVSRFSKIKILHEGMEYLDTLHLTASCRGIIVIPGKGGLNYCTGLTCVMEAFALGKPIISVKNPYYPFDIEKEGCGIYVNPSSPCEIVLAIRKIESDDELYRSMCMASINMAKRYNMEKYCKELFEIIENC